MLGRLRDSTGEIGSCVAHLVRLQAGSPSAHMATIKTILPLYFEDDPKQIVEAVIVFGDDEKIIEVRVSPKMTNHVHDPSVRLCGTLFLADDEAGQEGVRKVIEDVASDVDMVTIAPWRLHTFGLSKVIEKAWEAYKRESPGADNG